MMTPPQSLSDHLVAPRVTVCEGADISHSIELGSADGRDLLRRSVSLNSVEVAVDEGVRVALSANARETAVEEASVLQHLPKGGIAPVVGHLLREDLDPKVIVTAFEHLWTRENLIDVNAHHVLPRLFEGIFKGLLILVRLSFSVSDKAVAISNEDEHTTLVNTVQRCDIRDGVRVHEDEGELVCGEHLVITAFEMALHVRASMVVVHMLRVGAFVVLWHQPWIPVRLAAPAI